MKRKRDFGLINLENCYIGIIVSYLTARGLVDVMSTCKKNNHEWKVYSNHFRIWKSSELKETSRPKIVLMDNLLEHALPNSVKNLRTRADHFKSNLLREGLLSFHMFACYNYHLPVLNLPTTLTSLSLQGYYGFFNESFPSNLTSLKLSGQTDNLLPEGLLTLSLSKNFARTNQVLPKSLTSLTLKNEFCQNSVDLPPNLTKLKLGNYYNHPIKLNQCVHLKKLKLGYNFNQCLDFFLPLLVCLEYLCVYGCYDYMFQEFPASLKKVECNDIYQIINTKNNFITHLICHIGENYSIIDKPLPKTLTSLKYFSFSNDSIDFLGPSNVKELIFNMEILPKKFPKNVESIIFNDYFNVKFDKFNEYHCLTFLEFGKFFNQPLINLPPNLITLKFGPYYNQPFLFCHIPSTLETLIFGLYFNQLLNLEKTCIKFLIVGMSFNQSIQLPNTIQKLYFDQNFKQSLDLLKKNNLEILKISRYFPFENLILPRHPHPCFKFFCLEDCKKYKYVSEFIENDSQLESTHID